MWPLLGRDRELAVLRAAWQATGGTGRVVAIAGQAGSGKTRLITEFRDEAARKAPVLAARCHDGETALPFVLAADLLRTALAVRPDLPDVLPAQTAAMAGRLVPALATAHPDSAAPALDSPVAVTRLYAAIADTLLAAATGPGPGGGAGRPGWSWWKTCTGPTARRSGCSPTWSGGWPTGRCCWCSAGRPSRPGGWGYCARRSARPRTSPSAR